MVGIKKVAGHATGGQKEFFMPGEKRKSSLYNNYNAEEGNVRLSRVNVF